MAEDGSDLLCPPEKSPLSSPWSFWFDKKLNMENPTAADYQKNMNLLGTFNTVEDFWRHHIYIQKADLIPNHSNVYLFREDQLPSWERWPDGGCWILKIKRKQGVVNKLWQDLIFACIGEEFQQYSLAGVMLASRKHMVIISVWCARSDTRDRFRIGEKLKIILHLDVGTVLDYKRHQNSIRDGSSFKNAQSFVFAKKDAKQGQSMNKKKTRKTTTGATKNVQRTNVAAKASEKSKTATKTQTKKSTAQASAVPAKTSS
jgi:translation initiation factor 4E